MENNLQSFVLNTIIPALNDPHNQKYWLPTNLQNLKDNNGTKLLPINEPEKDVGYLQGKSGENLAIYIAEQVGITMPSNTFIPTPDTNPSCNPALPYFVLKNLKIQGLENAYVTGSTTSFDGETGYQSTITVNFGHYTLHNLTNLSVDADFELTQKVCSTTDGKTCDGQVNLMVDGRGHFLFDISNCFIDAVFQLDVEGKASKRSLQATLESLTLRGKTVQSIPEMNLGNFTILDDEYDTASMIRVFLESSPGQQKIFDVINEILNQQSTLDSLNNMLNAGIGHALDPIFGSVPPAGLPLDSSQQEALTDVDLYMFDRARLSLSNPDSDLYLPKQVASIQNPTLEPYKNSGINIPDQTLDNLKYTNIILSNVEACGVSNISLSDKSFLKKTYIDGQVNLSILPNSQPLVISGNFSFTQVGFKKVTVMGTFKITIIGTVINAIITPTGSDIHSLKIDLSTVNIVFPPATHIQADINTGDPVFDGLAKSLLTTDSVLKELQQVINQQVQTQLPNISDGFTSIFQKAVLNQLEE